MEELTELSKDNLSELEEIKPQFEDIEQKIIDLEEESLYSGEFDNHSAVLTVNAGAGGVDLMTGQIFYLECIRDFLIMKIWIMKLKKYQAVRRQE